MGTIIILHSISTDFNHSAFTSYYTKFCNWSIHEDDMVAEDETEQENKLQENDSDISSDDEVNHTQQY